MRKRKIMSKFVKAFRKFIDEETGYDEDCVDNMYLKDPGGCVPEEYIGDDLLQDIKDKFYFPHRFVADFVEMELNLMDKHKEFIFTCIDPSYEDRTIVLVTFKDIIVFHGGDKAWNFWFHSEEELERYLEDVYITIINKLKEKGYAK